MSVLFGLAIAVAACGSSRQSDSLSAGGSTSAGADFGASSQTGGTSQTGGAGAAGESSWSGAGGSAGAGGTKTNAGGASTASSSGAGGASESAGSGGAAGNAAGASGSGGFGGGAAFAHPGLLHSRADLERMKAMVAAGTQPYLAGYNVFQADPRSSASYALQGPFAEVGRNPDLHKPQTEADANAAYQNAVMWAITGDAAHAAKAIQILDAWSSTLTTISGNDAILAASLDGFKFVNAAEIMRYTNANWTPANIARAEDMFRNVFYPVIQNFATFANGNWSTGCIKTMMGIGVFTDDQAMFDRAVEWYRTGKDNGALTHYVINATGQSQESGRDQQHAQLGIGHLAEAAEIGWHQGLDLYGAADNRLLAGFEYAANYNLGNTVPFQSYTDTTGKYTATEISTMYRGQLRPIYEMVYHHFQNRRAIACPFTEQAAAKLRPEGTPPFADHPGFGTLLFTKPPGSP